MSQEFFEVVNGRPMRGFETTGPATEYVVIEHTMPDGTIAREIVMRSIEAPSAEATPDAQS